MTDLLGRFSSLSLVGKAVVLLGVAAVIVPLAVLFRGVALLAVLAGLLLVIGLLFGLQLVMNARARKQAAPFEAALAQSGAATPVGISEPARRARLDDLRKSFESGLDKFRAAGKSFYALPWYLVVGEPGSGKTEAIRHCNVGFPPGLQDELQGAGGTLNMNWWFTNHAVLIDTAGRLMFEEVEAGSTGEWTEFLKLLRKYRPNCPVNGLLLVIPAESLVTDTADAIQSKSSRIARQLDTVQRTLGVRFPVFVVVTKADLINGFREFFDTIKEPHLQHQMLGWSNPDDLDTPFDPEKVDEHLREVGARLSRRRLGLLLDPVHTESPSGRRTDQVDALYAFPESMLKLAPRLRQYLSNIFVQGEWSAKPLFLRGIYFTSSMREGSALDADLAEALGLPVGQLPEGRVWERDRAFFLRDLFMSKVFRERGLVTRVLNTARLRRARTMAVAGTSLAGLALLAGLTWMGARALSEAVNQPLRFWTAVSRAYGSVQAPVDPALGTDRHVLPLVQKQLAGEEFFSYRGDSAFAAELAQIEGVDPALRRRAAFPRALRESAEAKIPIPAVFRPVAVIAGDRGSSLLANERAEAARALIRASVALPLLDAARTRIRTSSDQFDADVAWSAEATGALAELIRLYAAPSAADGGDWSRHTPGTAPLLRCALAGWPDLPGAGVDADLPEVESAVGWLFAAEPARVNASLRRGIDLRLIEDGVRAFAESARSGLAAGAGGAVEASASGPAARTVAHLQALADGLGRLETLARSGDAAAVRAQWPEVYARVSAAAKSAQELAPTLGGSVSQALAEERRNAGSGFERSAAELAALLGEASLRAGGGGGGGSGGEQGGAVAGKFMAIKADLERQVVELRRSAATAATAAVPESVRVLEERFLSGGPGGLEAVRTVLARLDERVRASVGSAGAPSDPTMARAVRAAIAERSERLTQAGQALAQTRPGEPLIGAVSALGGVLDAADRRALAGTTLADVPTTATAIARLVGERASGGPAGEPFPAMPMAVGREQGRRYEARFEPASAAAVLRPILELRAAPTEDEESSIKRALALEAAGAYVQRYAAYWSSGVIEQAWPAPGAAWAEAHRAASAAPDAWMHHGPLKAVVRASKKAARTLLDELGGAAGLLGVAELRELDRLERSADRGLSMLDEAGFERAAQGRLGAWRGLGGDAGGAVNTIASALAEPARASDWFLTVPSVGSMDLTQAYWRGLFLRMAGTLRRSGVPGSVEPLNVLAEASFPLGEWGAAAWSGAELDRAAVEALIPRLTAAVGAGGSTDGAGSGAFGPDGEIEAHASALAGRSAVSSIERARLAGALAMAEWLVASGAEGEVRVVRAGRGAGGGSGGGAGGGAAASMTGRAMVRGDLVRIVVAGAGGGVVGERAIGGSWPLVRLLVLAQDVEPSGSAGAWSGAVEVPDPAGGSVRVEFECVFRRPPPASFGSIAGGER